jgi:hypothetical protein
MHSSPSSDTFVLMAFSFSTIQKSCDHETSRNASLAGMSQDQPFAYGESHSLTRKVANCGPFSHGQENRSHLIENRGPRSLMLSLILLPRYTIQRTKQNCALTTIPVTTSIRMMQYINEWQRQWISPNSQVALHANLYMVKFHG